MAITFPSNPADGDTFTWGGVRYTFDSTPGAWVGSGGSDPVILYGTTFPNNGIEGELFYYEGATSGDPARLYVYNGGVWVDAAPAADAPPIADNSVSEAKLADNSVSEAKLKVSNSPVDGYMLTAQSGNTGGLTWAAAPAAQTGGGGGIILGSTGGGNNTTDFAPDAGPLTLPAGATLAYYASFNYTSSGVAGRVKVGGSVINSVINFTGPRNLVGNYTNNTGSAQTIHATIEDGSSAANYDVIMHFWIN